METSVCRQHYSMNNPLNVIIAMQVTVSLKFLAHISSLFPCRSDNANISFQDNEELSEFALDGLKQVMAVKSRVVLPYLVPQVGTFISRKIAQLIFIYLWLIL